MSDTIIAKTRADKLRNEEIFTFYMEVAGLISATDAETLNSGDLTPKFAARLAALQKISKSPRTEEIHNADKERDNAYRALTGFNKVMSLSDNPEIREAARRVQIVIDTYGSVRGLNYEEETGVIHNLVQDLKSDNYSAAVTLIALTPYVSKLEDRNNNFKTLLNTRDEETAAGPHIAVKDARLKTDNIYARIRDRVNSYVDDETANPKLETFITQLNIIVKRFNTLAARHHRKGGKGGDGETTGGEEGNGEENV